ncbi:hypothetical protein RSAG8_01891, partial [Rhizoctonia solani AG-8 WAC10335]
MIRRAVARTLTTTRTRSSIDLRRHLTNMAAGDKKYIFTFKEGTRENSDAAKKAKEFIESQGGKITHDYGEVGFAAEVPAHQAGIASSFASNDLSDAVEAVEEDGIVTTQ